MKTELSFYRVSNGALAAEKLPARLKLLSWGENKSRKGPVRVTPLTLSSLPPAQRDSGFDRVALDYEHNTVPGTPAFRADKEPRKVAAFGTPRVIEGEGLFLEKLEWTPAGREFAREYCDLSPAVQRGRDGTVLFLHSCALCRQGAVDDLSFFSIDLPETKNQEDDVDLKELLLELLGLNADATDDEIQAAVAAKIEADKSAAENTTTLTAKLNDLAAQVTTLSAANKNPAKSGAQSGAPTSGELTALTVKVGLLEGNLTALSLELDTRDRTALRDRATREGKVIPLTVEQIAAMPLDALREMVDKLPATVPLTALTSPGLREQSLDGQITDTDKAVARSCGIDPSKLKAK